MTFKKMAAGLTLAVFGTLAAPVLPARAQSPAATKPVSAAPADKYANSVYLAYVQTTSGLENSTSRKGLEMLAQTLRTRTSIAPAGVVAVDPANDDISLLPFIYWPVVAPPQILPEKTRAKVQDYLDHGGFIVFDVHNNAVPERDEPALPALLGLKTNPLATVAKDHTLTKSFYLISNHMPGCSDYDPVYVETPGQAGVESVSVIVGRNNWASAWAGLCVPAKSKEQEMALRDGINKVVYALMGDYKSDQIHVPALLKRLENK